MHMTTSSITKTFIKIVKKTPLDAALILPGLPDYVGNRLIDPATHWARLVLTGNLKASKKNIQVAKRHFNDLEKQKFEYDPAKGNTVISFIETLPDVKTGKPNKLVFFQKFIVSSLYSWLDSSGYRRFSKAYVSMSRKQGKSILVAGINLYELLFGKNPAYSRQIYCTANAKEQAKVVWTMIMKQLTMVQEKSKRIKNTTRITESRTLIENTKDYSLIRPLSKDTSNLDGFEPYIGILDEFHEAKDDSMIEVLRSGMILLVEKLIMIISTAGFHLNGPMYKEYLYIEKLLNNKFENDSYFVYCAEQDNENEIDDVENWIKSNPLLENEDIKKIVIKNIREDMQESIEKGETHKIKTKNFNLWQSSSSESYLDESEWKRSIAEAPNVYGKDVYIGVDLSRLHDISAVGYIYPLDDKHYIDAYGFIATRGGIDNKIKKDKIDYLMLERMNQLELTTNRTGIIDYEQIVDHIINKVLRNKLEVKAFCYDPWGASQFLVILEKKLREYNLDWPLLEVSQGYMQIGPATKQLQLDLLDEKIIHSNNELLNIGVRNAITKFDNNANIILDKKKNREKIDSIVSVITGYTEAMMHEFKPDYNNIVMDDEFGF